ncbi:branched-chain amino acid ABC transporter permease [Chelatococcus reniformis]|uniref:Branched-chain amino acid ABC transporter permease n=1 Tax=Chelatococcus reniformis TaxID=1494448 RepID=A0A916XKI1_9HYPH|nr:branched-chain amino acid ABC transporter permease [Chelatococcus reniformis]GGC78166.1 branched-chain amino acid ABC transporter permease [Chelatococcus reniformis]
MSQVIQIFMSGLAEGCIYALVALGFVLIYKATEMVNFAQGDLMMLGAFVGYFLIVGLGANYWIALVGAVVIMAVFSYALDVFVLRRVIGQPQFAVVMLTIGLGFVFRAAASMIWGANPLAFVTPFTDGTTSIGGAPIPDVSLSIVAGTAVLCGLLFALFQYTPVGVAMQAASQNQLAAYYMGIPVKRIFALIWAISGGVAAVAGILLAPLTLIDTSIGFLGLKAFAAAVLGGFGSIPGALAGGIAIGLIEQFSGVYLMDGFKDIAAYVVLLLVLFVRPQGLFGAAARKRV